MYRSRGFTLVELLVVVTIVAILASIALPSYTDYIRRSKIQEASATLLAMRVQMEQFFQDNRQYTNNGAILSPCDTTRLPALKYFTITCPILTTATYQVMATGGTATDSTLTGLKLTIDEGNNRVSTVTGGSTMANAGYSGNGSCWVTRKGGTC